MTVVDSFHNGKFGSNGMSGTVSLAGTVLPVVVPVGFTVEDGCFDEIDAGTLDAESDAAGAAAAKVAKSKAQRHEERRIMVGEDL